MRVAHTSALDAATLAAARALLTEVFAGDFEAHDWEHALEEVIRNAYDLGALGSTDEAAPLYRARGWQGWRGRLSALTPAGTVRTPDEEGWVYVLPGAVALDLDRELTCDWRDGDVW